MTAEHAERLAALDQVITAGLNSQVDTAAARRLIQLLDRKAVLLGVPRHAGPEKQ